MLKSHIFDRTSVSSGSTIIFLGFKEFALMRIEAVSRVLVNGETKIISTSLF
jgi:hypothetical protein